MLNLRKFIDEIRFKNAEIPIYLYGETRTSQHIPNDILRELHGFIHMFEDTPEFVARHIIREAKSYLDGLAPPFFRALVHYAQRRLVLVALPGALRRRGLPEKPGRADVPPVLRREHAARRRLQRGRRTGPAAGPHRAGSGVGAQCGAHLQRRPLFFVTNGTSTSNKMVWHATVAPGDVVVVDRNCHKSILHAITMTGAIPVFLPPTRNHLGIIGPIPQEEFRWKTSRKRSERNPFAEDVKTSKPRILTLTQSTYDGVIYNVETIKDMLARHVDTLHFDEAWLPHAAFHEFYQGMHAIGKDRPRPKDAMIFATQSTHKLLAGLSQASQILVQDSETRQLDKHRFNEAYLMHTSTSPQYAIIASCDVAAAMMEPPGGTALVEESIMEALDFRRAMRKVDEEYGETGGSRCGDRTSSPAEGIGTREDWMLKSGETLAWLRQPCTRIQHAGPDQGHGRHARSRRGRRFRRHGHSGGHRDQVPGRARRDRREDRALLVLHHVHHRHHQGPLEHAVDRPAAVQGRLRQEPAAVARVARVRARLPALRRDRPA